MNVFTLSGSTRLVKTIQLTDSKEIIKTPYPNTLNFTSTKCEVSTIKSFYKLLQTVSKAGKCLIKGLLSKTLKNESRAGSTISEQATEWICLDLDGVSHPTSQAFLDHLQLSNTSHIVQYSASQGLTTKLYAHIFILLSAPLPPSYLKAWLQHLNLTYLKEEIALSPTGIALKWPLDITACQNDKLLYIAPPTFKGMADPVPEDQRIQLIINKQATLPISSIKSINIQAIQQEAQLLRDELRKKTGYKLLRTKPRFVDGHEHQYGLAPLEITGKHQDRGFTYFNINGGDSWAYYHPDGNIEFIYNFKGEPVMKTEEVFPEYYLANKPELDAYVTQAATNGETQIPMILRDVNTDQLYNGYWFPQENRHEFYPTKNEKRLEHFMLQHNRTFGDYVPQWKMIFNPENNMAIDLEERVVNLWQPTRFFSLPLIPIANVQPPTWPIINKLFRHVIGDDPRIQEHWLNWLAVIFQLKHKAMTAYVISTQFGAGKGLIAMKILRPLLGEHCIIKRQSELQSQFNSYLRHALLVVVDEAEISSLQNGEVIDSDLKNFITEPMVTIRGMHKEAVLVESRANFIFISNQPAPVMIPEHDRRYNVAMFQPNICPLTDDEIDNGIPAELPFFFSYIMQRQADVVRARKPLDTEYRREMMQLSKTTAQALADYILTGDVDFLIQQLPDLDALDTRSPQGVRASAYSDLMKRILTSALVDRHVKITREELFLIFDYCAGNMPISPTKFGQFLHHKGIKLKKLRTNGSFKMGIDIRVTTHESIIQEGLNSLKPMKHLLKAVK